ncbi:MAG TPA: hypothetical protein VMN81_01125 [Vicinamibacterales bacterium]|nr:hypothetical protein [Vicinamibacterales bacterium]
MMQAVEWTFYGYATPAGNRDVQDWYDRIAVEDERDTVRDTLEYLQKLPVSLWRRPEYKPLGAGLGEFRLDSKELKTKVRIYCCFWPKGSRFVCTLLLGRGKGKARQQHDIRESRRRLAALIRGEASIHEFEF